MASNLTPTPTSTNVAENLREWYAWKSQDFKSANYLKQKESKRLRCEAEIGYNRFEMHLDQEKNRLRREFRRKLDLADAAKCKPKSSILSEFLASPKVFQSTNPDIAALLSKSRGSVLNTPKVEPEYFCSFSESEEEEEAIEGGEGHEGESNQLVPNPQAETAPQTHDSSIPQKQELGLACTLSFAEQLDFQTSTPIKGQESDSESTDRPSQLFSFSIAGSSDNKKQEYKVLERRPYVPDQRMPIKEDEELKLALGRTRLCKWLQNFCSFNRDVQKICGSFEQDQSKKELRIHISRAIADRINDCAKKNSSNQELAILMNFFTDLFEGKLVQSWHSGEKFALEKEDKRQGFYAMTIICTRYLEQIKWDQELMRHIQLVVVALCIRQPNFYKIFCAKVVDSLTLLSMDQEKVISKLQSFGSEMHQEAASQWIANEQAIFRLFCRVQLALKSRDPFDSPNNLQGVEFVKMMFVDVVELPRPVLLCSLFLLGEIMDSFMNQICKQDSSFQRKLTESHIPTIRNRVLPKQREGGFSAQYRLDEPIARVLTARHEYLQCVLEESLIGFEH